MPKEVEGGAVPIVENNPASKANNYGRCKFQEKEACLVRGGQECLSFDAAVQTRFRYAQRSRRSERGGVHSFTDAHTHWRKISPRLRHPPHPTDSGKTDKHPKATGRKYLPEIQATTSPDRKKTGTLRCTNLALTGIQHWMCPK